MPNLITTTARRLLGTPAYEHLAYRYQHRRLMRRHSIANRPAEGEAAYMSLWHQLSPHIDPYNYRLYSHFCGPDPRIVPFDLLRNRIEPALNPPHLWAQYEDKNNFARYVEPSLLPCTVAHRQGGGEVVWDADPAQFEALILKPSIDASCGEAVLRFCRQSDGRHVGSDGQPLTEAMLYAYGRDFILQEAVQQHPLLSRLSPTAVCTIRLAVYRSANGQWHPTAAVLRVGAVGAVVDNIVAGGRFVGIDMQTGTLADAFVERDGFRSSTWNSVNLATERIALPAWSSVLDAACRVAEGIADHRLLALDVTITPQEKPMLIEYNIGGFSSYLFHFTGRTIFGPYTDEVIDWVRQHSPRC